MQTKMGAARCRDNGRVDAPDESSPQQNTQFPLQPPEKNSS
jgi:hypothetical protein